MVDDTFDDRVEGESGWVLQAVEEGRLEELKPVIVMTFWYVFGTNLYFLNFLNFYSSLGIDHDPPCSPCSHDLCLFPFFMFHSSHDHMAKRSHYHIMIFYMTFGVLLYGRIPTLVFFYFLHYPATPILSVYVDQRRSHLEKDTTRSRSVVIQKIPTVPRRTRFAPD